MTERDTMAPGGAAADSLDELAVRVRSSLAAGDRATACEAYEHVVERLQRRANRVAYWYLRDSAEADDAVQDAFMKAFERIDSYRPGFAFDTWFIRVLVNGCLDRLKARMRRGRWLVADEGGPADTSHTWTDAGPSPEARLIATERQQALTTAIETLPARQRAVVVLSQLEGMSGAEIGAMIGLSESTVRVHLFRAMKKLRDVLGTSRDARRVDGTEGRR
jgi:RNA polymerase sigma-70 factor (ECF subfamily)